jgi:uncharacterized protein YgiM (DUF1202 family)
MDKEDSMATYLNRTAIHASILAICLNLAACKAQESAPDSKDLPDLNAQIRPYVTVENTKVRTGPGPQFRTIGDIRRDAKVQVVGRDGDWVLIVSKKGNPPGYIEMASVKPGESGEQEASASPPEAKSVEGKYESIVDTQVRSGPGLHYPTVAEIKKGTKINVVEEEKGWLKVESKRGNKPGYVDASLAKPVATQ